MVEDNEISRGSTCIHIFFLRWAALIQICDKWLENMDDGKLTGVVFLDIWKAFDSINHKILLKKIVTSRSLLNYVAAFGSISSQQRIQNQLYFQLFISLYLNC